MEHVALITILLLMQCIFFMMKVGMARGKYNVQAPDISGDEMFNRTYRVHQNTLEQLILLLPAMWVCAYFHSPTFAAISGAVFLVARFLYGAAYIKAPESRGPGMGIGFLAIIACLGGALWGIIPSLIAS